MYQSFSAHNRYFEDKQQYSRWIVWRWTTAEDQNPEEISLSRCNTESIRECWRLWYAHRESPRTTVDQLIAAIPAVRRAINFKTTSTLKVEEVRPQQKIFWPGTGYVPDAIWQEPTTTCSQIFSK